MAALAAMLWAVCGLAHADWAVRGDETGVTLIGAVSDDAASGEPNGAHFEATCIKGSAGAGPLSFAFTLRQRPQRSTSRTRCPQRIA
jgi:hypothetical protein